MRTNDVDPRPPLYQRIALAGSELVDYVTDLINQGTPRRLVVRKPNGDLLMEVPLTAGIAVGGVLTLIAPTLAAIGAMAALVAKVQVEIIRSDEPE